MSTMAYLSFTVEYDQYRTNASSAGEQGGDKLLKFMKENLIENSSRKQSS